MHRLGMLFEISDGPRSGDKKSRSLASFKMEEKRDTQSPKSMKSITRKPSSELEEELAMQWARTSRKVAS